MPHRMPSRGGGQGLLLLLPYCPENTERVLSAMILMDVINEGFSHESEDLICQQTILSYDSSQGQLTDYLHSIKDSCVTTNLEKGLNQGMNE